MNPKNLGDFYDTYIDKLYNFALYKTGHKQVAEDIAGETFLKYFRSNSKIKNPQAYLYQICRNLIIDYYRTGGRLQSLDVLVENGLEPSHIPDNLARAQFNQILEAINTLPIDQRDVLLLQYVQDIDNKTICTIMDKSESAVKSLAYRGLETIRARLNPKP